jgi:hypothetical protein
MQLAPALTVAPPAGTDPVAWALVELRGPRATAGAPVEVTEVSAYADRDGHALVTSGTFGSPLDPVERHTTWFTDELYLNDDANPDAALREARLGVNELMATVDGVAPLLGAWAQPIGVDVPREADSAEVVLRRASGARERYVVPLATAPAALIDVVAAVHWIQRVGRTYYRANPAPQG